MRAVDDRVNIEQLEDLQMNRRLAEIACLALALCLIVTATGVAQRPRDPYRTARVALVDRVLRDSGLKDPRVLETLRETPRHEFVPRHLRSLAYEDMSLPIGDKQTISSPFIVGFMTEALEPKPTDKVLEIGTGSGYQAAILAKLVKDVYTIEIVPALGRSARRTLQRLRYDNVHSKIGDGFKGWVEHAPFDKIIVTCSPENVPQPLIDQLCEGGRIIVPTGKRYQQTLFLMRKSEGRLITEALRPTLFVPMTGAAEDQRKVQPDPLHPAVANSGFEKPTLPNGFVPDWYYQRQLTCEVGDSAPEGRQFATMTNEQPGKQAHALQGFPVDGREVRYVVVSALVKFDDVRSGLSADEHAGIAVTFYDDNRKQLGYRFIGPFRGSADWSRRGDRLRVPGTAREAILRIGLFGAAGSISFDKVTVTRTD